ncbi:hypothetical protein GCM10009430_22640 [Aquimarina litoralis]|uniref:IPT/TIG domain-containing protein n=1 Tax=Aquimarina litoralis TaxID=584605 RepID=A0ABP3TZM7_9FLAO
MIKQILPIFLFLFLFISCSEDEGQDQIFVEDLKILTFQIIKNDENGIFTQTRITPENVNTFNISNHGVIWMKNGSLVDRLDLGELKENVFEANFASNLVKGEQYAVFPYLLSEYGYTYGDTLSFVSNVEVNVLVKELTPRNGFIRDTLYITGENFCGSTFNSANNFLLGDSYHRIIFESDSLIKAVINPYLSGSELSPTLKSCGISTEIEGKFSVNPPVLDSISSKNLYVEEELNVYGKNIHHQISKVWLGDIETELVPTDSITLIKAKIPESLPPGKLDFKLQVLDKIIERPSFYQSTSPVIEEVTPRNTGFLDTITIKGKFLDQRSDLLEVVIGGRAQNIISTDDQEIKVIIDKLFTVDNPELVLNTGTFSLVEPITMLPPQIIGFDKDKYHLDDEIVIKTKYYLGNRNTAKIGNVIAANENAYSEIDYDGTFTVNLKTWLNLTSLYPDYLIRDSGLMDVFLETNYGIASSNISIFPPEITKINQTSFFHESSIQIEGINFGYDRGTSGVGNIYIDDVLIPSPGNSSYSIYNYSAQVDLPNTLYPGDHNIKIVTGGQESNEINFTIKSLEINDLNPKSGTRKDTYILEGDNLEGAYSYGIKANGYTCTKFNATKNRVEFKLPQGIELDPTATITVNYGPQVFNVGTITVTEPYERIPEYQFSLADYYIGSYGFEFNNSFHYINRHGIFRLDNTSYGWDKIESNIPDDLSFVNGKTPPPVIDNKLYIKAVDNIFRVYDLVNKVWEAKTIDIESNLFINRAVSINGSHNLFLILSGENFSSTFFYKYNLATDEKESIPLPPNFEITAGNSHFYSFYSSGNRVYISSPNRNILVYDVASNYWNDIGYPKQDNFFYDMNLYEYKNILYFSGGIGNVGEERRLFTYDYSTNQWTEKTPMLNVMRNHFVFEYNEDLYFLLGNGLYGYENNELMKYDIDLD